jgi:hypothetical protein
MRALRHRQIARRPLVGADELVKAGEDAQQGIRWQREVIHADIAVTACRNDRRGNDIGPHSLQH